MQQLAQQAESLAKSIDWAPSLATPADPLQEAGQHQTEIQRDVRQVAQDVARAARHERRLQNERPVAAMQQAATDIEEVAGGEIQQSLEQLAGAEKAASEGAQSADRDAPTSPPNDTHDRPTATSARQSVQVSEEAIATQAGRLGEILDRAQQAADAKEGASLAAAEQGAQQPGQSPSGQQAAAEPATEQGDQAGQGSQTADRPDEGEAARAELLARTLDELDRQQAEAAAAGNQVPADSSRLLSLSQAARARNAALAAARTPRSSRSSATALDSLGRPPGFGDVGSGANAKSISRDDGREWGMLREHSAQDTVQGTREAVAAEYRKSVEAYFRVLAERSRQKK